MKSLLTDPSSAFSVQRGVPVHETRVDDGTGSSKAVRGVSRKSVLSVLSDLARRQRQRGRG